MAKKFAFAAILLIFLISKTCVARCEKVHYLSPVLYGYVFEIGPNYLVLTDFRDKLTLKNVTNLRYSRFLFEYAMVHRQQVMLIAEFCGDENNYQITIWCPRLVKGSSIMFRR